MRKEVLIAIIIGLGLGLVITLGIWTADRALKETAPKTSTPSEEISTPTPVAPFSLTLVSPEDNAIIDQESVEVSGSTAPKAVVVILYQEGEKIIEADAEGKFKSEIDLAGGANEIKITAYNQEGEEAEKTITVVYSTAEI